MSAFFYSIGKNDKSTILPSIIVDSDPEYNNAITLKLKVMELIIVQNSELERFKDELLKEIRSSYQKNTKKLLKSAEVRKLLGGISAAKLQSLRISGHLPAIDADGLWLYDLDDISEFIKVNKINSREVSYE